LANKTLAEAIKNRKDNNRYNQIRRISRKNYLQSDRPKCCEVCGYDKHIEICHIKDIASFSKTTLISEINDLSNLIALCRNHHWELDHGHLTIEEIKSN
jgi:predicted restriction endonuclease